MASEESAIEPSKAVLDISSELFELRKAILELNFQSQLFDKDKKLLESTLSSSAKRLQEAETTFKANKRKYSNLFNIDADLYHAFSINSELVAAAGLQANDILSTVKSAFANLTSLLTSYSSVMKEAEVKLEVFEVNYNLLKIHFNEAQRLLEDWFITSENAKKESIEKFKLAATGQLSSLEAPVISSKRLTKKSKQPAARDVVEKDSADIEADYLGDEASDLEATDGEE